MFHAPGPIDSTPSVLPGTSSSIFFGVGNAAQPYGGGYYEVNSAGQEIFSQAVNNQPSDPKPYSAVAAGIAIGDAPGIGPFAAAGSLGQSFYAFNPGGGVLGGFPFFQGDGDFSTPAIANLYYGGQPYIVTTATPPPGWPSAPPTPPAASCGAQHLGPAALPVHDQPVGRVVAGGR